MKIILYGYKTTCELFQMLLPGYDTEIRTTQEVLIPALMDDEPSAVFVLMDNAAGMEGVIAIRRIYPELPIAWFSSDRDFAPQAFRLNVEYFTTMPISVDKVEKALKKCGF